MPIPELTEKEKILKRIEEILKEYNGLEGHIPVRKDHEYWQLTNQLRSMK